ncbi:MAG: DHH family phosphoesterase [Candidatus Peregrinibacteria bacterium]
MSDTAQKQAVDLIRRSKNILILPSSPIDGDSLSSAIAMYLALKKLDKDLTVVCKDPIPEILKFLPHTNIVGDSIFSSNDFIITINAEGREIENIKSETEGEKLNIAITTKKGRLSEDDITFNKGTVKYDLIIAVDCAELTQFGEVYENNIEMFHQIPVINVDHHISNTHFGKINYVDIMAASATELLLPLLEELSKVENRELIDEDIATLLLTGIITDTGSFQNANTTPRSFASSAKLISYGARQQEIIQHVYKTKQLSQLKLWGRVLSKIQTDEKHKIVWSTVSTQDFRDTSSMEQETGDIIDELMTNAPGAEIILLLKEKSTGEISVSMRTTTPAIDASKLAEEFGGGGHTQAAGFRIKDASLRDAEYKIINRLKKFQATRLGLVEEEKSQPLPQQPQQSRPLPQAVKTAPVRPVELQPTQPQKNRKKHHSKNSKTKTLNLQKPSKEDYSVTESTYKFDD